MKYVPKFIALSITTLAFSVAISGDAQAAGGSSWGYVCQVTQYPMNSSMGSGGYINFDLYSGSGCTGAYVGSYYLMSAGNSYPGNNYFSEASQLTTYRNLLQAAYGNKKVYVNTPTTPNFVATNIYFYNYN